MAHQLDDPGRETKTDESNNSTFDNEVKESLINRCPQEICFCSKTMTESFE
jgi:hypothetical protein